MSKKWNTLYMIPLVVIVIIIGAVYSVKHNNTELKIHTASAIVTSEEPIEKSIEESIEEKEVHVKEVEYIKVYITGEVKNPNVYTLEKGSRIVDVLELAGGAKEEANLEKINLSAYLEDAQHVIIPKEGEEVSTQQIKIENNSTESALININAASLDELMTLPGIGKVTGLNIIQYREQYGAFESIEAIKNVTRIGDKIFGQIKSLITVD